MAVWSRRSTRCTPSQCATGGSSPSRRSASRHVPPVVREAAAGAPARPHPTRSGRSRDRDRVRLAPLPARTARRRPDAARKGGRVRGRPRDRGGAPDRPHLLGQARRIPGRLQGQRFRDAGLPPCVAPSPGGAARGDRRRRGGRPRFDRSSRSTVAAFQPSRSRSTAAPTRSGNCPDSTGVRG